MSRESIDAARLADAIDFKFSLSIVDDLVVNYSNHPVLVVTSKFELRNLTVCVIEIFRFSLLILFIQLCPVLKPSSVGAS